MSDPTLAAFAALREKLSVPERWTQEKFARIGNAGTHPLDPRATCWCLEGAVKSLNLDPLVSQTIYRGLAAVIRRRRSYKSIVRWNDAPGRKHHQVLKLINTAEQTYRAEAAS